MRQFLLYLNPGVVKHLLGFRLWNFKLIFSTYNIFCVPCSPPYNVYIVQIKITQCLKEFRYCVSGPVCSKIIIFCHTEAGLTSKCGRISPKVYWWHQNQSSYIVRCLATSRNGIKVFGLYTHSPTHPLTKACMEAGTLPKNK